MKKTIIILVSFLLVCALVSYGVYYAYNVPIESCLFMRAKIGTGKDLAEQTRIKLNGQYSNIYDGDYYTDYCMNVKAPLMIILSCEELEEYDEILDVTFEWEIKTLSAITTEM